MEMRLKYRVLLSCLLLLVGFSRATALEKTMIFHHFSVPEGLSQRTVRAIEGDAMGNLWIGTHNGLNYYDGYGFTSYYAFVSSSNSLSCNSIHSLHYSDAFGKLWIGTALGLSSYDCVSRQFSNYELPVKSGPVVDLVEQEGILYVSTEGGLYFFDEQTAIFSQPDALKGLHSVRSVCLCEAGLLIAAKDGVYIYKNGASTLTAPEAFRHSDVSCIVPFSSGYWVATLGQGLYRTNSDLIPMRHFSTGGTDRIGSDHIRVMRLDRFGRLWAGTYDGLSIYDDMEGRFYDFKHTEDPTSLSQNSIWSLYMDRQRGVWIGTYYGGLNYWNSQNDKIRSFSFKNLDDNVNGFVNCLTTGRRYVWAGTNDDGLFRYDFETRTAKRFYSKNLQSTGGRFSDNVKCVLEDGSGRLYVGTHLGGLVYLDPRTHRATIYPVSGNALVYNGCYSLLEEDEQTLTVGATAGLFLFDKIKGQFSPHPAVRREPQLARLLINALFRDAAGHLWVGTEEGLFMVGIDGKVADYSKKHAALKSAYVNFLTQDYGGDIWVGTNVGLFRVRAGGVTRYTSQDGLPNDYVFSILEDETKTLWLSTGRGLCCLDKNRRALTRHGLNAGTSSYEFTPGAACACPDGSFIFGGLNGLTQFRPLDVFGNPWIPRPFLTDIAAFYNQSPRLGTFQIERRKDGSVEALRTSEKNSILTFSFSVSNLLACGQNKFSYCLEGYDNAWYETDSRKVTYSNIPAGTYRFHLRAANNDGRWSRECEPVEIRILPPWWRSGTALTLFALLFVGLLYLGFRFRHTLEVFLKRIKGEESAPEQPEETPEDAFVARARQIVEAHLADPEFSSEQLAAALYMSRSNLYLKLTEATGIPASQFIRDIRLEQACRLLEEQKWTISEISEKVGFSSPSYLSTSFKKYKGCLPTEYLKLKKQKE